jgi:hypothetical protein
MLTLERKVKENKLSTAMLTLERKVKEISWKRYAYSGQRAAPPKAPVEHISL